MNYPYLSSLLIVATLAGASLALGRLFALAFRVRLLLRPGPEPILASCFVGTGLLALTAGWGAYLGRTASQTLQLGLVLLLGLSVAALARARWRCWRWRRAQWYLLPIMGCLAIRTGLCLYPLYLGVSLTPYNDTFFYISVAEYLQTHDFITPVPLDPEHPTWTVAAVFQSIGHRMGPVFLLALSQAASQFSAFELFPALMAWGAALNVAGAFLLARWLLGVPRFPAIGGAFLAAVAADSLTLSTGCGFFCQVYGTATLSFALAVLSRLSPRVNWTFGNAWLFGVCVAMQLSVYSELSPFLGIACLAWLMQSYRRARLGGRRRSLIRFVGMTMLAIAALANFEIQRTYIALGIMPYLNGVGWHVPWRTIKFFKFGLGAHNVDWLYAVSSSGIKTYLLSGLAMITFVVGLIVVGRARRRALPLIVILFSFVGLILWFRYQARDPWTGDVGHTFNLFKLGQWFFPLAVAIKMAGLAMLFEWLRRAGRVDLRRRQLAVATATLGAGMAAIHLPVHRHGSELLEARVWAEKGTTRPLHDLAALRKRIDEIAPTNLFYLQDPAGAVNNSFIAYALNAHPFVNGWGNAGQVAAPWLSGDNYNRCGARTLFIQLGVPPFEEPMERLPFHYSIVDPSRPVIYAVSDGKAIKKANDVKELWIERKPMILEVVSPRACLAELRLRVASHVPQDELNRPLRVNEIEEWTFIRERGAEERNLFIVRLSIPRGLSRIALHDATDGKLAWGISDAQLTETSIEELQRLASIWHGSP